MALLNGELKEQAMPEATNVIDITLDTATKQRFRINGDNNSIIELNTSDLGILERYEKGLADLEKEMEVVTSIPDDEDDKSMMKKLMEADKHMRDCLDFIFDSPISAVCGRGGTMYDPKDGKFRYEVIIESLLQLYTNNINQEAKLIANRVKQRTAKYTTPKGGKKK